MLSMAARQADAVWMGTDEATLALVRAAAGDRRVTIIAGDAPPLATEQSATLKQAVEQDGEAERKPRQTMAEWGAIMRGRLNVVDELLVVAWEHQLEPMLGLLRAVKEALV